MGTNTATNTYSPEFFCEAELIVEFAAIGMLSRD
jgi:hypothetical protein